MASNASRPQVNRGFSAPVFTTAPSTPAVPKSPIQPELTSYFSPQAPSTALASPASSSPFTPTSPSSPPYPVITATVTSRHGSTTTTSSVTSPEHDNLNQFAMHIPNPPTLALAGTPPRRGHHSGPQVQPASYSSARPGSTPYDDLPSPMDRSRRMPSSSNSPQMHIAASLYNYTLSVQLPAAIQPEMVTVCANKGDKIKVVADVWHLENESHYEWSISFPPHDIDMGAVHARFDDSRNLFIDVRRIPRMYRT